MSVHYDCGQLALMSIQFCRQVHFWTCGNVSSILYLLFCHQPASPISDLWLAMSWWHPCPDGIKTQHFKIDFAPDHTEFPMKGMMCKCHGSKSLITWTRGESRSKPQACLICALFPASIPGERAGMKSSHG